MRSLSIFFGYSLLAAGLYWESHTKPNMPEPAMPVKNDVAKAVKLPKVLAVNHTTAPVKTMVNHGTLLEYLTAGGWKMRSVTSDKPCDTNGDGYETSDIFAEMPACAKDDILHIRKNGRAVYQRGLPCGEEPATESYAWSLSDDGLFTMTAGSIIAEMFLVSADANTLKMIIPMEEGGEEYRFTVTYTH